MDIQQASHLANHRAFEQKQIEFACPAQRLFVENQ
jgi:hypothetical protein